MDDGDVPVRMGERVQIHEYVSIGTAAFTYLRNAQGVMGARRASEMGVMIGNDVEIMCHTNVDSGTERATRLGDNVKVDAFCQVGHDCVVARGCILTAHTVLAGFVHLEEGVRTGVGALVRNRKRVGRGSYLGMGAVVHDSVPPNAVMVGNPARYLRANRSDLPSFNGWKWRADLNRWWVKGIPEPEFVVQVGEWGETLCFACMRRTKVKELCTECRKLVQV